MKLTLLLDLDDTLLLNNMDTFLPAYLKALSTNLSHLSPSNDLIRHLLASTQKMVEKRLPGSSLEETFDEAFYPALGTTKDAMRETIDQFYDQVYPSLEPLTSRQAGAKELIEFAFQRGYDVVIATNPLFPSKAIDHRLRWAGVPPEEYPYTLITAYQKFHFSKPSPAYYAEILAQIGWPNQPAVMIGNEINDDIKPASVLGLPVYWLTDSIEPLPPFAHALSSSGSFEGIIPWLLEIERQNPVISFENPAALLAILRSTPAALDTLTREVSQVEWVKSPKAGEWSLTEILCHMRDVDREVNLPRLQKMTREANPLIAGQETDNWAVERNYAAQKGPKALIEFIEARSAILDLLDALEPQDWERKAQHTIFGPTTLQEMVSFIATHDRTHIHQSMATLEAVRSSYS